MARVLLFETRPETRELLALNLEAWGYAPCVLENLNRWRVAGFDAAVIEVTPDMDPGVWGSICQSVDLSVAVVGHEGSFLLSSPDVVLSTPFRPEVLRHILDSRLR